jgi:DAACS family dicarboxylate/amino acid:cation (Na+ or H+) symporter
MVVGGILGSVLGPAIAPLGKLGGAFIQVIKALATPLLFLVLLDSFLNSKIHGRSFAILVAICLVNSLFAVAIGMGLSNGLRPGEAFHFTVAQTAGMGAKPSQSAWSLVLGYLPAHIFQPFLDHSVPGAILLALLFGASLSSLRKQGRDLSPLLPLIRLATDTIVQALHAIVRLSPLAVLAVVAQSIGEKGWGPVMGLGGYVGCALLGMAIQVILVYQSWIVFFAKMDLKKFWSEAKKPVAYSFGVNSSLATLPLTLESLKNLKISPTAARLGAGLGTNFNNDGILLYEAMAILLVAQAYGIHLSWFSQFGLAVSCVVLSFGVSGVPEAGMIALSLLVSNAGLPSEILPLLLTVDWILGRCRSATNVLGDLVVSIVLDQFKLPKESRYTKSFKEAS